jgi:hypothetical protein
MMLGSVTVADVQAEAHHSMASEPPTADAATHTLVDVVVDPAAVGAGVEAATADVAIARDEKAMADARAALEVLRQEPWERKEPAMSLLVRLIGQIVEEPEKDEYRTLNEFNKILSAKLFSVPGCLEFLHAVGFHRSGSRLTLSREVDVRLSTAPHLRQLKEFMEKEKLRQWRRERDERIAKERAADEKPTALRCRARSALQTDETPSAIQRTEPVKAQQHNGSCACAPADINVVLQGLSQTFTVTVSSDEHVGGLRSLAARLLNKCPHQIKLLSVSSGLSLSLDHEKLSDVGITDNSVVMLGVGGVDEIEEYRERLRTRAPKDMDTWAFTRELFEAAIKSGLPADKARGLKSSLHAGALSQKDIRDLIIQEMVDIAGSAAPLMKVTQKFFGYHENAIARVMEAEKAHKYGRQTAKDNAKGIIAEQNAGFTGHQL